MGNSSAGVFGSPATALFGSARQAVLEFFFTHPNKRYFQHQVVEKLALGSGAVQRELARLSAGGILKREVEGRQAYYQVDPAGLVHPELQMLLQKTMEARRNSTSRKPRVSPAKSRRK